MHTRWGEPNNIVKISYKSELDLRTELLNSWINTLHFLERNAWTFSTISHLHLNIGQLSKFYHASRTHNF